MSEDEERAMAAYRAALGGKRTKRNLGAQLLTVGSVLAVIGAVGVGAMFFTGGDRVSQADPSGRRDAFLCEKALSDRREAERDAVAAAQEAGKPPPRAGEPQLLYFCSPSKTGIVKLRAGRGESQTLMANAIYALEVDGTLRVKGLEADGMRFGFQDRVCRALAPPPGPDGVLLKGPLVDPASC